jgi:hypothetical protein
MWKTHDEEYDHALFDSSAREELRFILQLSVITMSSVCLILTLANVITH